MLLLGIILLPLLVKFNLIYSLLVKFNLIYRTWAFRMVQAVGPWGEQIGLSFRAGARGSGILLDLPFPWSWRMGLRAYFLNPINYLPALVYGERVQGLYHFLNRVRPPRVCSGLGWLGLCRRHMSCDNDDFSVFAPTSSSYFSFF